MALTWGPWSPDPSGNPAAPDSYATPYGDWYATAESGSGRGGFRFLPQTGVHTAFGLTAADTAAIPFPQLPVPARALPAAATRIRPPRRRPPVLPGLTQAPGQDAVIVGVIDAGIALAHDRFRRAGGVGTRILSAWSQGAAWTGQRHLPFGREWLQAEIDALMAAHTHGGTVDEAAFNRAAGLVDFADPQGERWVETEAPHGTHVADLACGADPYAADPARDRTAIIAVDLAPRLSIGPSGSFLEFYVIWAIRHVVTTADAIWQAAHGAGRGYPVAINLSYGLQAGPKDGTMPVQKYIAHLNASRPGKAPVRLILPAGNDNLEQGTARLPVPATGGPTRLTWRIRPEDRTANYVEAWAADAPGPLPAGAAHPHAITVTTPQGVAGPGTAGQAGQVCDLSDGAGRPVARLYCRGTDNAMPGGAATRHRLAYILCTAPTWRADGPAAPPGAWTIALHPTGAETSALVCVQSDQDLTPGAGTGLISYFDDPDYATHDAAGAVIDTYRRDGDSSAVLSDHDGPVLRRGTLNAIAGSAGSLTIAGYRASDGWPADYSSSGSGPAPAGRSARGGATAPGNPTPDAACVSDDGIWRLGRLAAGGRSGSAVVMQGTSFATAEATRLVAAALRDWLDGGADLSAAPMDAADAAARAAAADAAAGFAVPARQLALKLGAGRFAADRHGRVGR
jgi:hypothetical protein